MTTPRPSRRAILRGGAGVAVVLGTAGLLASCASTPEGPDALEEPLAAARADATLAAAVAGAFGNLTGLLTPVAEARRAHAEALAQEIRRVRPDRAQALDAPPPASGGVPGSSAEALTAVREALTRARDGDRRLALGAEPYRCGLLASVAASCAGHATVLA